MTDKEPPPRWDGSLNRQKTEREHTSVRISPPPMKRQRTGPTDGRHSMGTPTPTSLSVQSATRLDETRRRHSNHASSLRPTTDALKAPLCDSEQPRRSFPFSYRPSPQGYTRHGHGTNLSRGSVTYPSRCSDARSSSKPVCRLCLKSTNAKYDPIVTCPSCRKHYHDSCRKPRLIEGVDPQRWRCSNCLSGGSKRTSSISTASCFSFSDLSAPPVRRSPLASDTWTNDVAKQPPAPQKSMGVMSKSAELRMVLAHAEQNNSSVLCGAHVDRGEPSPLYGCGDQQEGEDERFGPEYHMRQDQKGLASSPSNPGILTGPSNHEGAKQIADSSKHLGNLALSDWFRTHDTERTEIPNTPTQRSSQVNVPSSTSKPQSRATNEGLEPDASNLLIESNRSQKITSVTVLCSKCQRQRVLAKEGVVEVICRGCQKRSLIAESGKLEIPETPEVVSFNRSKAHTDYFVSASEITSLTSHTAGGHAPLPWFQSGLVATTPKIIQKKVGDKERDETACTTAISPEHDFRHGSEHAVFSCQVANGLSQIYVPKSDRSKYSARKRQDSTAEAVIGSDVLQARIEQYNEERHQQNDNGHESPHLPPLEETKQATDCFASSSSTNTPTGESTVGPVHEVNMECTIGSESKPPPASASNSTSPRSIDRLLSDTRVSIDITQESLAKPPTERRYTYRQLARIALVAADGFRLTTSQILLWIARTFSYLRVGEGAWEIRVRSALSGFDEFRGDKIPGAHGNKKLYGFANAEIRAQYEAEYTEYRTASDPLTTVLHAQPGTTRDSTLPSTSVHVRSSGVHHMKGAKKSALTLPSSISTNRHPKPNVATKRPRPKSQITQDVKNMAFMPFERSKPRQPLRTLDFDLSHKRKADFPSTSVQFQQTCIETMTEAEKVQKIVEIEARPSRKKYFGSDHRLAHKRRYGLQDIHDERDGAWRPSCFVTDENEPRADQDVDMNDEGSRTLREIFDLPDYMIPMNDGRTELAFRDGTLVNGKLPRPRNVYKVGKMFGGELTVRIS